MCIRRKDILQIHIDSAILPIRIPDRIGVYDLSDPAALTVFRSVDRYCRHDTGLVTDEYKSLFRRTNLIRIPVGIIIDIKCGIPLHIPVDLLDLCTGGIKGRCNDIRLRNDPEALGRTCQIPGSPV